VDSQGSPVIKC